VFGDVVGVVLFVAQLLDGVFSYLGIGAFGVTEGNPLIAHYIHHVGLGASLTFAKIVATVCAMILHLLGFHRVLAFLTLMYVSLAVLPWTVVLFLLH
jgi:hypothetical protein